MKPFIPVGQLTQVLKELLEGGDTETYDDHTLQFIQAYNVSRCADALERIATHIENGQIATLHGEDIANGLNDLVKVARQA